MKIYGKFPSKPAEIPDEEYYAILTEGYGTGSYDEGFS